MPEWLASPKMWGDIFVVGVPIAEKILRPALVYVFLVVALRVFGKRELAQLNPFDLVVLLSLSNTVQNAIIGEDNSVTGGVIGAFGLLAINWLVVRTLYSSPRLTRIVEGRSTVLIRDGQIDKKAVKRESLTHEELVEVIHKQGFERLSDVSWSQMARFILRPSIHPPPTNSTRNYWTGLRRSHVKLPHCALKLPQSSSRSFDHFVLHGSLHYRGAVS